MGTAWLTQYDVTDPTELGTEATDDNVSAYNAVQRERLVEQYPDGPPALNDEDETDPVEEYIERHWLEWLVESIER